MLSLEKMDCDLVIVLFIFLVGDDDFESVSVAEVSSQSLEFVRLELFVFHRKYCELCPVGNQNFLFLVIGSLVHEEMQFSILPANVEDHLLCL